MKPITGSSRCPWRPHTATSGHRSDYPAPSPSNRDFRPSLDPAPDPRPDPPRARPGDRPLPPEARPGARGGSGSATRRGESRGVPEPGGDYSLAARCRGRPVAAALSTRRRPRVTVTAPSPIVSRPDPVRPTSRGSVFLDLLRTTDHKQSG